VELHVGSFLALDLELSILRLDWSGSNSFGAPRAPVLYLIRREDRPLRS